MDVSACQLTLDFYCGKDIHPLNVLSNCYHADPGKQRFDYGGSRVVSVYMYMFVVSRIVAFNYVISLERSPWKRSFIGVFI